MPFDLQPTRAIHHHSEIQDYSKATVTSLQQSIHYYLQILTEVTSTEEALYGVCMDQTITGLGWIIFITWIFVVAPGLASKMWGKDLFTNGVVHLYLIPFVPAVMGNFDTCNCACCYHIGDPIYNKNWNICYGTQIPDIVAGIGDLQQLYFIVSSTTETWQYLYKKEFIAH